MKETYWCNRHSFGSTIHDYCPFCKLKQAEADVKMWTQHTVDKARLLDQAEAREKVLREALEKIAPKDYRPTHRNHMANRMYHIAEQALLNNTKE